MTIPVWVLLGFAVWTLLILVMTVGIYRWSQILSGRAQVAGWRPDGAQGADWYQRGTRAHANCVENLPVYAAIVVVIVATGLKDPWLDTLSATLMAARVVQTLVHVSFTQTNAVVSVRFTFFFVQVLCMLGMAGVIVARV